MTARATLTALAPEARRWSARCVGLFAFWAIAFELATHGGFIAAVASPPGFLFLLLAGAAALLAAAAEPFANGAQLRRLRRGLALAGAGLLLASPPLSLTLRETRMLQIGEGQTLPADALPGLPALRVGRFALSPDGPVYPLSKAVTVPLETSTRETVNVGLFPPARLGGWRLAVFQFGYAPALEWVDAQGRELAAGYMMLGTFEPTEEDARLVTWLPEPNVMMGVGTFPPKVEDLLSPPGTGLHLHVRLMEATINGTRRHLAVADAYKHVMDGRPSDPTLYLQVFQGKERRFEGVVRGGQTIRFADGAITVSPDLPLWANVQAVRDPFVEAFLLGGAFLLAGALLAVAAALVRLGRGFRRGAPTPSAPPPPPAPAT